MQAQGRRVGEVLRRPVYGIDSSRDGHARRQMGVRHHGSGLGRCGKQCALWPGGV